MPLDPAAAATATTTTSRPISPLPQPQLHHHHYHHHHYPSQQQTLPILGPNPHIVYPFAPKGVVPLDYFSHALHVARQPTHVPFPHAAAAAAAAAAPAASPSVKKSAARSAVAHVNGGQDTNTREKNREDTYIVVRDRKVRIMEDASLYALCRSWLTNGINEESQSQQKDVMKALPKPLPASMVASYLSNKKEDEKDEDEKEENEQSVENLSPQDLLNRHIKRAKKVRACLREERLQRITRYRSRLRLLLPPSIEQ